MLTITGIRKTYRGGVRALDGVDLQIEPGMFGLLGPNGAGKTTLMRLIAGLEVPDRGEIRLEGVDIIAHPSMVRERLGYLPQEFGVYPKITAEALLDHLAVLKGIETRAERRDQVLALLEKTNLLAVRKRAVSTFSGGMRQRFGIAQALLGHPRLIIVDEPTAGLDPEERNRFHDLLSRVGEEVVVILSTHIVADVRHLCRRMAVLFEGRPRLAGEPEVLIAGLEGRVWARSLGFDEVPDPALTVLSKRLIAGRPHLRVLADHPPDPRFRATAPTLEDVYFSVLAAHREEVPCSAG